MPALKLRRIDLTATNAAAQITKLRDQFRIDAEVVSAASEEAHAGRLRRAALPGPGRRADLQRRPRQGARRRAALHRAVRQGEAQAGPAPGQAGRNWPPPTPPPTPTSSKSIRQVQYNVLQFQSGLLHRDAEMRVSGEHELQLRYRPLDRVGVYCPGGAAAYPSTLLMTVCPAQAAGRRADRRVHAAEGDRRRTTATCSPPATNSASPRSTASAGRRRSPRWPTASRGCKPVDMIVGPGNQYVALAKKYVFGQVAIDCIAGPSEIVVAADDSAHPDYVALDLIAQAEHSPGVAILVTWYEPLIDEVQAALQKRLAKLSRGGPGPRQPGALRGVRAGPGQGRRRSTCVNALAPEHLHIQTRDPDAFARGDRQRRGDLPRAVHPGRGRRLRGRPVARPADRRHRPVRQRAERQRLPQADEHHAVHPQRASGDRPGRDLPGEQGRADRPRRERRACGRTTTAPRPARSRSPTRSPRRRRRRSDEVVSTSSQGPRVTCRLAGRLRDLVASDPP